MAIRSSAGAILFLVNLMKSSIVSLLWIAVELPVARGKP